MDINDMSVFMLIVVISTSFFILSLIITLFLSFILSYKAEKFGDPTDSVMASLENALIKKWFPKKYQWLPKANLLGVCGLILSILLLMVIVELGL